MVAGNSTRMIYSISTAAARPSSTSSRANLKSGCLALRKCLWGSVFSPNRIEHAAAELVERRKRFAAPIEGRSRQDPQVNRADDGQRDRDVDVRRLAEALALGSALFHVHRHNHAQIVNHRKQAVQHADDGQADVTAHHRTAKNIEFPDETGERWKPGQR